MTYYETIKLLDDMINKAVIDDDIKMIESADISLQSNRYYRFLTQVNYMLTERLNKFEDKISQRVSDEYLSKDEFTLELSNIKNEIKYAKKFLLMKHLKEENRELITKEFIKKYNEILDKLKEFFENDYDEIIDEYYLKENDLNEL